MNNLNLVIRITYKVLEKILKCKNHGIGYQ